VHLPVSTSPSAMQEPIPKCERVQTLSASGETRSSSHGLPERKTARMSFSSRLTRAAAEKRATTPEAKSAAGERRFARPRRAACWHRVSPASNYLHRRTSPSTSTSTSRQVRPDHTTRPHPRFRMPAHSSHKSRARQEQSPCEWEQDGASAPCKSGRGRMPSANSDLGDCVGRNEAALALALARRAGR
jgi:hypothetical protein